MSPHLDNSCSSVTYYLTVDIGSWAGRLDTRVTAPTYSLVVDNLPLSRELGDSGSFMPYGQFESVLTFVAYDSAIANAICDNNPHTFTVTFNALVSAGIYSAQITRSDTKTWSFSS